MTSVIISDCPRHTVINPSTACQAGTTLTCSSSSYPAASYVWIDNFSGNVVKNGSSYVLPVGKYDLTCVAYVYANCTNGYYSPVAFADNVTTEGFPFGTVLNRTNANNTIECSDNTTISGLAIGECVNILLSLWLIAFSYSVQSFLIFYI